MAKAIPSPELSLAGRESRGQRLKEQRPLGRAGPDGLGVVRPPIKMTGT